MSYYLTILYTSSTRIFSSFVKQICNIGNQITSETGKGQYLGCTNGSNVQIVGNEMLWIATYVESSSDEGSGFVLLPIGQNAGEGHEMVMNGSADWTWCGANSDAENFDGNYIWGIWHWESYGNIELSQTLAELPNGYWKLTTRLMNNHTEDGNMARIFAGNNSMLAGTEADYGTPPKGETCIFSGEWASSDKDMSQVMTVYAEVTDGTLTIGARSNGFFKIDDFQLTYMGSELTSITTTQPRIADRQAYDLQGRKVNSHFHSSIVVTDGVKRLLR